MTTMKKLMEGWRGYEKDVLNEQRTKKPADRILAEMVPDQSIPYYPAGNAPKPSATATKVFDTVRKGVNAVGRLNKYGIPTQEDIDAMRDMSSAELSVYNLTYDDLDRMETMDWTDIIIDFDSPADIALNVGLGAMALGGFGTAGTSTIAAGASKAALIAKTAINMAKTIKAVRYAKKAKLAASIYGVGKGAIASAKTKGVKDMSEKEIFDNIQNMPSNERVALMNTNKPEEYVAKDWASDSTVQNISTIEPDTYVVSAGDNMSDIGRDRGYSTEDMIAANPQIDDPDEIEIDQEINLPTASTRA